MIRYVEMINWRRYDQRKIFFEPGITFLMGINGAGKTSVLEAICYGLTGETGIFDSKSRPKLLRNSDQSATVNLCFDINDEQFLVSRSQSFKSAAEAQLIHLSDGKILASSQNQSTRHISKLMGVSDDFLRRIVYMAEGDVFRFINQPPGEALETQIRQVLGLTQFDEFNIAVEKSQKNLKQQIDGLQTLSAELDRLDIQTQADLEGRLKAGEDTLASLLEQLESIAGQVVQIQATLEEKKRIQGNLLQITPSQFQSDEEWQKFIETPIIDYFRKLEHEIDDLSQEREEYAIQKAHLDGETLALQRIISIFEPYKNQANTLLCPICQKPMTETERHSVFAEQHELIQKLRVEIEHAVSKEQGIASTLRQLRMYHSSMKQILDSLTHGELSAIISTASYNQLLELVFKDDSRMIYLQNLEQERQDIQTRLNQLQAKQAEYLAIQNRLNGFGFQAPEDVNEALVSLEIRNLSLRAAVHAAQQTLTVQRNTDMQAIYTQIAHLWGAFKGENGWRISLDNKGLPTLQNDIGQSFDLQQLSGGEKTALLIMLHTIIAHNFSQSDFILVDEPLEHLDPVNRRSLIRFLIQGYRQGMFKQAIIATFEESLIRKYLSEDGIQTIMI